MAVSAATVNGVATFALRSIIAGSEQTYRYRDAEQCASGRGPDFFGNSAGGYACLAFSPDGRTLVAGKAGPLAGEVVIWDLQDGRRRSVRTGHTQVVNAVAFSPDGRMLATGGQDGTVQLWKVQSMWRQ